MGKEVTGRGRHMGPGGDCVCPKCGYKISHQPGKHCKDLLCPKCGINMVREGGLCQQA
jgi:hypothetical protein